MTHDLDTEALLEAKKAARMAAENSVVGEIHGNPHAGRDPDRVLIETYLANLPAKPAPDGPIVEEIEQSISEHTGCPLGTSQVGGAARAAVALFRRVVEAERERLPDPRATTSTIERIRRIGLRGSLDRLLSNLDTGEVPGPADDCDEESYRIGHRDGYEKAVQDIDLETGGDGEFRYALGGGDRHCPDANTMKARIVKRLSTPATGEVGRLRAEVARLQKRADWLLDGYREMSRWGPDEAAERTRQYALDTLSGRVVTHASALDNTALAHPPAAGWRQGHPEPDTGPWFVHRDQWSRGRVAHWSSGTWWVDGSRYHGEFDRYAPLAQPPASEEDR